MATRILNEGISSAGWESTPKLTKNDSVILHRCAFILNEECTNLFRSKGFVFLRLATLLVFCKFLASSEVVDVRDLMTISLVLNTIKFFQSIAFETLRQ